MSLLYAMAGGLALFIFLYLLFALFFPERF
jgi:hypothetical protein